MHDDLLQNKLEQEWLRHLDLNETAPADLNFNWTESSAVLIY